jgi:hypothetical protein
MKFIVSQLVVARSCDGVSVATLPAAAPWVRQKPGSYRTRNVTQTKPTVLQEAEIS